MFVDKDYVRTRLGDRKTVMINALPPELHAGKTPSRYGRPGRVPGSVNVPAGKLLDRETKAFVSLSDANNQFTAAGVEPDKEVICYCGGGISATVDLFMLHQLGYDRITLYDASMGEWAKDTLLPIETDSHGSPASAGFAAQIVTLGFRAVAARPHRAPSPYATQTVIEKEPKTFLIRAESDAIEIPAR